MRLFAALVARDLRLSLGRPSGLLLPMAFLLLVAVMFPFAVGADAKLLGAVASAVLWVAALLAGLLPIERLVEEDRADGTLDQLAARGLSMELWAAARIASHWIAFAPGLLGACLVASVLLRLPSDRLAATLVSILLGTPAIAALAVVAAALTAGLRRAGALAALRVLPLAVPVLIFGAGAALGSGSALRLLAGAVLLLVAASPFAAGAALRHRISA